jgi:hypothetical protein
MIKSLGLVRDARTGQTTCYPARETYLSERRSESRDDAGGVEIVRRILTTISLTLLAAAVLFAGAAFAYFRYYYSHVVHVDYLYYANTPQPSVAIPFVSAPDIANGNIRYTGTVVFTGPRTNFSPAGRRTLYVRNTGTVPLAIHPQDFRFGLLDATQVIVATIAPAATPVAATPLKIYEWHDIVQPGETVYEDFLVSPYTDMAIWMIAGNLGCLTVPMYQTARDSYPSPQSIDKCGQTLP